jgi:GT2 family glycosyltransferase
MSVGVVIVTYNGARWIHDCFTSVLLAVEANSIFVVDNASSDETVRVVRELGIPPANIVESKANLGFGKANNIGIRLALGAGARQVFLLNQDTWIKGDAIAVLAQVLEAHPGYGIVSPLHWSADGSLDANFDAYLLADGVNGAALRDTVRDGAPTPELTALRFVNAAAWMMSRRCLETVGGFEPFFQHYGEDENYIQRLHYHGLKLGVCPSASIVHDRGSRAVPSVMEFDAKAAKKSLLLRALDPHESDAIVGTVVRWNMVVACRELLRGRWARGMGALSLAWFVAGNRRALLEARRVTRQAGSTYLGKV